jgi:hypothetical protein
VVYIRITPEFGDIVADSIQDLSGRFPEDR